MLDESGTLLLLCTAGGGGGGGGGGGAAACMNGLIRGLCTVISPQAANRALA